ncbi:MAG: DUF484 family protein [Gammaproteobacteria bacterium]|nr:DUF484 family protein [Gammaproteobacteria bacterium]|tara:strand:+ start:487 stop:1107 length:621 start_codon:yes stop_codon:yes gene_type:complete
MAKKIDVKDVELFLLDNLDFFVTRESLVSEMKFKHSQSSASSILERQIMKLRDEHKNVIELLKSFIDTATINEDLFKKSKDLTLKILESATSDSIKEIVEKSFKKDFGVDECLIEFFDNKAIDKIEKGTGLSMHKGAVHCGSFSNEKMGFLFKDNKIESLVIAVIVLKDQVGLLKLGSYDRAKYLGDEDTTFIEYIRDILEKKLSS